MAQDVRHFLFGSDYPMPALVWQKSGSIDNVGAFDTKSVTIAHNLGFTPLLIGVWSTNRDFQPSYDIANYIGAGVLNLDMQLNSCGSDSTNVYVEAFNASSDTKTLYYRLMAYAPSDYTGNTPNVSDTTHFQFSTNYNYPKIVKEGKVSLSAGGSSNVSHGLNYIPQAKVWGPDANGHITPLYRMVTPFEPYSGPTINNSKLTIDAKYSGNYYYQIYGDEA